jgi:hypothetical protein
MTAFGTSRTSQDVRLESAKWGKADLDQVAVTNRNFISTRLVTCQSRHVVRLQRRFGDRASGLGPPPHRVRRAPKMQPAHPSLCQKFLAFDFFLLNAKSGGRPHTCCGAPPMATSHTQAGPGTPIARILLSTGQLPRTQKAYRYYDATTMPVPGQFFHSALEVGPHDLKSSARLRARLVHPFHRI